MPSRSQSNRSAHHSARLALVSTEEPVSTGDQIKDVYIAIMGVTGSGKSTFIELCTKQKDIVGHGLKSCTAQVEEYIFDYNVTTRVHLIDTPGFDDTYKADTEILREIASFLGSSYQDNQKLNGLLYLHRISDPRMTNTANRNLRLFKKLCGSDCFKSIILVTTFSDLVPESVSDTREKELLEAEEFWGKMYSNGSKVMRHHNSRESAMKILEPLIGQDPVTLAIQEETINVGMPLDETAAGRVIDAELYVQLKKYKEELENLRRERKTAERERDHEATREIKEQQARYRKMLEERETEQESLRLNFETLQREKEREFEKLQEQVMQQAEELKRMREDPSISDQEILLKEQEVEAAAKSVERRSKRFLKKVLTWVGGRWEWLEKNPDYAARIGNAAMTAGMAVLGAAAQHMNQSRRV